MSIDFLNSRRSMRKYTDEPLADADLQTILNTAMLAPSSKNRQPWQFVIVTDAGVKDQLIAHHQHMSMAKYAAASAAAWSRLSPPRTSSVVRYRRYAWMVALSE